MESTTMPMPAPEWRARGLERPWKLSRFSCVESIGVLCAGRVSAVEVLLEIDVDASDAVVEAGAVAPEVFMRNDHMQ